MDQGRKRDVVSELFALLTAKLEDGAALAADGQDIRDDTTQLLSTAAKLRVVGGELAILADAITALLDG